MDTIENMHTKMQQKSALVKRKTEEIKSISAEILAQPPIAGKEPAWMREKIQPIFFDKISAECDEVFSQYSVNSALVLVEYYEHSGGNIHWINEITLKYNRVLSVGDYVSKLGRLVEALKDLCVSISDAANFVHMSVRDSAIIRLESCKRELCGLPPLQISAEKEEIRGCDCGATMISTGDSSIFSCKSCGKIRHAIGQAPAISSADSQRVSLVKDEHIRHYRTWVKRLQADKSIPLPAEGEMKKIREYVKNPHIVPDIDLLYCANMRSVLRDLKLTKHNNIIASIIVEVGGPKPYKLTSAEENQSETMFKCAMALYEKVVTSGGNKPYYPFFIFKIWQIMFRDNPKKLKTLLFFHLQQWDTVMKNDENWEKICKQSRPEDGLIYIPTPHYVI